MKRALEGIRVIDMSHVLAAPTTTMFLADLGAEVIHLEPPHGDDAREYGPFAGESGQEPQRLFHQSQPQQEEPGPQSETGEGPGDPP